MKKTIFLFGCALFFITTSCKTTQSNTTGTTQKVSKKKSIETLENKYTYLSSNDLKQRKGELNKEIDYLKVKHFLNQVEQLEYSHMPLTKIKNDEVKAYWESIPKLQEFYHDWKLNAKIRDDFQDKYEPGFRELSVNWHTKSIELQEYYKQHRALVAGLRMKYPDIYPNLLEKHTKSLRKMWLEAGKYMLEKYKIENKDFPTYWIPAKRLKTLHFNNDYKELVNEIITLQKELNKRSD